MSPPLGEESASTEPVDCGVNGAWVEAGESSDIGGGEGVGGDSDLIGGWSGNEGVRGNGQAVNRRIVRRKVEEKEAEVQDESRTRILTDIAKSVTRTVAFRISQENQSKLKNTTLRIGQLETVGNWKGAGTETGVVGNLELTGQPDHSCSSTSTPPLRRWRTRSTLHVPTY